MLAAGSESAVAVDVDELAAEGLAEEGVVEGLTARHGARDESSGADVRWSSGFGDRRSGGGGGGL